VDDFYVYYELTTDDEAKGIIKAIAPHSLKEMSGTEYIRITPEQGKIFTMGGESLNRWFVGYNTNQREMVLLQLREGFDTPAKSIAMIDVPTNQRTTQTTIIYVASKKMFNVRTRRVSISRVNVSMLFFVTELGDPNILFHYFKVSLYDSMGRKGVDIPCDVDLPRKFSIFTKPEVERYQLRIT
jgi:hypothetical protein